MVAIATTILLILGIGGTAGVITWFAGSAKTAKDIAIAQAAPTTGTGILGGLFNILFGSSTGFLNKILYWAIFLVIIYIVLKLFFGWLGRRKKTKKSR